MLSIYEKAVLAARSFLEESTPFEIIDSFPVTPGNALRFVVLDPTDRSLAFVAVVCNQSPSLPMRIPMTQRSAEALAITYMTENDLTDCKFRFAALFLCIIGRGERAALRFISNIVNESSWMPYSDDDGRFELAKAMNLVVEHLNGPDTLVENWYLYWPDGADEDDIRALAGNDESMDALCSAFHRIVGAAGPNGFDVGDSLFGCAAADRA